MNKIGVLDELDLSLIGAMQIQPRAAWKLLGEVLGVSPVTVARRWHELSAAGLAWVTVCASPALLTATSLALLEVRCEANRTHSVMARVLRDPYVVNAVHASGSYSLLLTVWTPDVAALSRYVLDRVSQIPGVLATSTCVASAVYADGSRWRLPSLDAERRRLLSPATPIAVGAVTFRSEDRPLVVALSRDGRIPHDELGAAVGISTSAARRRLARMLRDGGVTLRCEVSQKISNAPVEVTFWIDVPPGTQADAAGKLALLGHVRLCAALLDQSSLLLVVWLRSAADSLAFEAKALRIHPGSSISRRVLTLRHLKLISRILDEDGRAAQVVPADIWQGTPPAAASGPNLVGDAGIC